MKKHLLKIKWENVLLILLIPLTIAQVLKAHSSVKVFSFLASITLYGGFYTTIQMIRQEALLKVKDEIEKPIFSVLLNHISIKKERLSYKQAIYKRPSLYIKSEFFN